MGIRTSKGSNPLERAQDAEWLQTRPGERCLIRTSSADTNGAFAVVEIIAEPGDGTPVHIHRHEDEHYIVLEGIARFRYGESTFEIPAGSSVSASRNIPHSWCNPFDFPLRMLAVATPGGCEQAFRLIASGEMDAPAVAKSLDIEVIGPPMLAGRP